MSDLRTTIRLPEKLKNAIRYRAAQEVSTLSEIVRRVLNREFGFPDAPELDPKQNPELPLS